MQRHLIPIFRSGRHTAMNGSGFDFSESDIALTVQTYNPVSNPAPLVLGHPENNQPAYGVVSRLAARGGKLYALAIWLALWWRGAIATSRLPFMPHMPLPTLCLVPGKGGAPERHCLCFSLL